MKCWRIIKLLIVYCIGEILFRGDLRMHPRKNLLGVLKRA